MKKLLTILLVLISFSSFAQFEAGEYINSDTVKIDGVPLLLNTFKQGNLGGASNIFYSTGASSQPASGSVNQVTGGGLLLDKYLTRWDGSKFVNSGIIEDNGKFGIGLTNPQNKLDVSGGSLRVHKGNRGFILSTSTNTAGLSFLNYGVYHSGLFSDGKDIWWGNASYDENNSDIWSKLGVLKFTGNVGIGTTSPLSKLSIKGGLHVGGDSDAGDNNILADGTITGTQLISNIPTGTPPLVVASSTKVDNLNVSFLEGHPASYFETANVNIQRHITNDNDTIIDNEIQDLSRTGNTLSLSSDGTTVDLSDLVNPDMSGYRLKTDHDSLSALDEKSYNSLTDKPTSLPASDVYPWAKAATKPTYDFWEVRAQPAGSYATTTQLADQLSQTITNGVTTKAPSEDAVYDALAGKASVSGTDNYIMKKTGDNTLGNSFLFQDASFLKTDVDLKIGKVAPAFYLKDSHSNYSGFFYVYDSIFGIQKRDYSTDAYISAPYGFSLDAPTNTIFTNNLGNTAFGHSSPLAKLHPISTTNQARLGYDANKYTDLSTGSTGNLTIDPTGDTVKVVGAVNSTGGFFKNGVEITGGGGGISNIGIAVPTGLTVSPASLTANGTFTFGLQSGYSIPTTANQTNWTEGYNNQISTVAFSGSTTKQITLTQKDGGQIFGYFTDLTASDWTATTYGIKYGAGNIGVGVDPASNAYIKGGDGTGTNIGVYGASSNNSGVYGTSTSSFGVRGLSNSLDGIYGVGGRNGVLGASTNGTGVYGTSSTGYGGVFEGLGCKATKFYVSSLNTAPASSTATGTTGEIRFTADYIYVCVATNTWKRTQISTW